MTESTLLTQLKEGKPEAVREWYAMYRQKVLSFILQKISELADADEITQEVFVNALKQLSLFRGQSEMLTWMLSIARHEVADYYRKKYAKRVLQLVPLESFHPDVNAAEEGEAIEIVQRVLAKLSPVYHELLLLKYIDGKSVAEIAEELRRTIKAVESDLFRARQEFRALYSEYAHSP